MFFDHFQSVTSSPAYEVFGGEPIEPAAISKNHLDADRRKRWAWNPRLKDSWSDKDLEDFLNHARQMIPFASEHSSTRSRAGIDAAEYVLMSRPAPRLEIHADQIACFDHRDDP
jgi:hypothetical protein